jgi:hypothetical protein
MTEVGKSYDSDGRGIDIIKRGPGSLQFTADSHIPFASDSTLLPWGYNSAAHMCGDEMWFAVPMPTSIPGTAAEYTLDRVNPKGLWYGSWLATADCA